jgi:hypothetical protein
MNNRHSTWNFFDRIEILDIVFGVEIISTKLTKWQKILNTWINEEIFVITPSLLDCLLLMSYSEKNLCIFYSCGQFSLEQIFNFKMLLYKSK